MPFVVDPNLEEEENQDPGSIQISGAGQTANSGGGGQEEGKGPQSTPNTGSGFQNLDTYLNTNNAGEFANKLAGNVQSRVDEAKQNFGDASKSFSQKVESSNSIPTSDQVNSAIANPTGADKAQFQKWESQNYEGPNSLAQNPNDYSQFWSGTEKANAQANALGSEGGRFALLDTYFGRPNYNFGQKSLDNLLVQGGNIGDRTKGIQDQAVQLKNIGADQSKTLANLASNKVGEVNKSRQSVRNAIGLGEDNSVVTDRNAQGYGAIGQAQNQASDALAAQNADRASQLAKLRSDFGSGQFSQEELDKLGLSAGQNTYGVDFNHYLNASDAPLTLDQSMTPEQRAKIQALSSLAGIQDSFASGTASETPDLYGFNKAGYEGERNNRISELLKLDGFRPGEEEKALAYIPYYNERDQKTLDYYLNKGDRSPSDDNIIRYTKDRIAKRSSFLGPKIGVRK